MTTYRIEMMDKASMHEYYSGGWNFSVTKIWVEAETKEEAKAKAQAENPNMVINDYIVTKEEIEAEEAAKAARAKAEAEKEAAKAVRKAEREAAKAAEMGLTVEEYNEYKKEAAKVRRYEREAANLEKYIEEETKRVKEEIEWRKRKAAEIKEKLGL